MTRRLGLLPALFAVLVASALVAVAVGAVWIPPLEVLRLVAWKLRLAAEPRAPSA